MKFLFRCLFGALHPYQEDGNYYVCKNCGHKKEMKVRRQDGVLRSRKTKEWQITFSNRSFATGIISGFIINFLVTFFERSFGETTPFSIEFIGGSLYFAGLVSLYLFIILSMFLSLIFSVPKIRFILPRKKIVIFISGVTFGIGLMTFIELTVQNITIP